MKDTKNKEKLLHLEENFLPSLIKEINAKLKNKGEQWIIESKVFLKEVEEVIRIKTNNLLPINYRVINPKFNFINDIFGIKGRVELICGPPNDQATIIVKTSGIIQVIIIRPGKSVYSNDFKFTTSNAIKKKILKELRDYLK